MTEGKFNPFALLLSGQATARLCKFQLVSAKNKSEFLRLLENVSPAPLVVARVLGWIIKPTSLSVDALLSTTWDFLVIYETDNSDPLLSLRPAIQVDFTVTAHVPAALLDDFGSRNRNLLSPSTTTAGAPPLSRPDVFANDSQPLKMTEKLFTWFQETGAKKEGKGAVSMLNFLAMKPGKEDLYHAYGKAFHDGPGVKRGGIAKIVAHIEDDGQGQGTGRARDGVHGHGKVWDEVAVGHYPSLWHFADMVAGEDYQSINDEYRIPSLKDTLILCTTEVVTSGLNRE